MSIKRYQEVFKDLRMSLQSVERAAMDMPKRPHKRIPNTDLVVEYFVKKKIKIPLFNQELTLFHVTEEDLFKKALENLTPHLVCNPFREGEYYLTADFADGMSGAEVILLPQAAKEVKALFGDKAVMLITSKNEVIVKQALTEDDYLNAKEELREINGGVHPDDIVSNNVYVFDEDDHLKVWEPKVKEKRYLFDMDGTLVTWRGCEYIQETFAPGYFLEREMDPLILKMMSTLFRSGKRVGILSAVYTTETAQGEKREWLKRAGILSPDVDIIFIPYGQDKSSYVDNSNYENVLIDDYSPNLKEWEESGLPAVKYLNGINGTKGTWRGKHIDKNMSLKEAIQVIINL